MYTSKFSAWFILELTELCILSCPPGGQAVRNGPFQITPDTGRVFLWQALPRGKLHYVLNLTAEDDGLCCGTPGIRRQSEAALIVEVMDINDNRPEFPNCTQYQQNPPSVKENSAIGSSVFQVLNFS